MNQRKKIYLDVIRIIAILLVIFNHTDGFVYYTLPGSIITHVYSLAFAIMCRTAVPLFFMVSGALLLAKEESLSKLIKGRIARILAVLVAASLLYYLFDIARGRIEVYGVKDFALRLSSNGIRDSFWFLYTYISVLFLLPFLRKAALGMNKEWLIYLIGLKALTDFVFPLARVTMGVNISIGFGAVIESCYYMLLGYYLDKVQNKILFKNRDAGLGMLTVSLMILVFLNGIFLYAIKGITGEYKTELPDIFVFLTTPIVFLIVKKYMEKIQEKGRECRWISVTGSCVFGIYLLDNFLRWQFLPVYLFLSERTAGILANSVYILLTFITGLVYTWILKKIPVVKKYI